MERVGCDLCGSDRSAAVFRQRDFLDGTAGDEFTVVQCAVCGLRYLNPRPSPTEIGRYYPPQYFSAAPSKSRTEVEQSIKRVSNRIKRWVMEDFYGYPAAAPPPPWRFLRKCLLWPEKMRRTLRGREILLWVGSGRLLDVGCGRGDNLRTFQEYGWDVHGIELNGTAVRQARERVGDRVHTGTLHDAPFQDESFDLVLFSHSLEHLFSPSDALARARRLLKPAGVVVIVVPNAESLEARLFGPWWVHWELPRHLYHFARKTLTTLLEQEGFHVVRVRTGVGSLFFMASLERVWTHRYRDTLPMSRVIEKLIARPFCLLAGHLGYGTEIIVHAVKATSGPARGARGRSAAI